MHEELARAMIEGTEDLRALHHRWAMLYQERLDNLGQAKPHQLNGSGPSGAPRRPRSRL
jgi:hypothetical protein